MWRGNYGTGLTAWQAVIDEALTAADPCRTPHRLAEILLANDPILTRPTGFVEGSGLPSGAPPAKEIRTVAAALLEWSEREQDCAESSTWRVLGLLNRWRYPRLALHGSEAELHLRSHIQAASIADSSGPLLQALVLVRLSSNYRNNLRIPAALATAQRAAAVADTLEQLPNQGLDQLISSAQAAHWLSAGLEPALLLRYHAHKWLAIAARFQGDYPRAVWERDITIEVAHRLTDRHPAMLADALGQRQLLARALGDISSVLSIASQMENYATQTPVPEVQQSYLRMQHQQATFFDDWETARAARLARARVWLRQSQAATGEIDSLAALKSADALRASGNSTALIALGNDAYELAANLIDSGRAGVDPEARVEARAWLGAAEAAWADIALNGTVAVGFRRLELDAIEGTAGDPLDVGRAMVGFSRQWRRPFGQRRSAVEAVRWGAPGDRVVLDRLLELRENAPPVDAAFLDLGIGHWQVKAGDAHTMSGDTAAAVVAWREAVARAQAAAGGLSVPRPDGPPVLLNPFYFIEALRVQADAMRRLRGIEGQTGVSPADELAVRVASLPAIAQRLSAAGTPRQRGVIDTLYADWLAGTAVLAADLGEHSAADAVAEVARRDMVGTILFALTSDPSVPEQVADLARRLVATLNATTTDTGPDTIDGGEDLGDGANTRPDRPSGNRGADNGDPDTELRAGRVDDQLTEALDVAGQVVGPVARALFDPRTVLDTGCAQVLAALHPTGSAAVLSLWLTTTGPVPRLVRRLVWRPSTDQPIGEHLDIVDTPRWLPGLTADTDQDRFLARVDTLTTTLLPGPLLDLLATPDPDHPINLTIVPTGLLGIPFAALPVTDRHLLIDLATITTVQSLQTALTLATTTPADADPTPIDLAIYDFTRLTHTRQEYDDLITHRPTTRRVGTLAELATATKNPSLRGHIGILALAIHGTRGADGWSQTKELPSGERLTAGHVLQWYIPRLVVGGSCNTSIRTDTGGELGGFPLAFQLRGATTIIGTLYDVEDHATAQIMGLFYATLTAGHTPAAGLRHAQRDWINADRPTRLTQTHRWAYLLTYGTPT